MARKVIMTKNELIALMKTCKNRSEFMGKHSAKYGLVYKKYPELISEILPFHGSNLSKMSVSEVKKKDNVMYVYLIKYNNRHLLKYLKNN